MSYFFDLFDSDFLNKAYEFLDNTTPLHFDCGKICSHKCCNGGNNDGMLLFPGEEKFFLNKSDFSVYFDEKYQLPAVRCRGKCDRKLRPISCRIFPYMFYAVEKGDKTVINVAPDTRALNFCNILDNEYELNPEFLRKMRMLAKLAETDCDAISYIKKITDMLTDCGGIC